MNYSSGVWGLGSLAVAQALPTHQLLWLAARVLLDAAGGLFLLYLLTLAVVTAIVLVRPGGAGRSAASAAAGQHRPRAAQ